MTYQTDTVVKKRRALIAVGVFLLALCAGGAYLALKGGKTGGATLGGYDDMTKEEIQAELDRQARESMMTISLDMTPTLSADGSKLAVRVANVEENRFDQLIEVEQDGEVIGSYKGLKPGEKLAEGRDRREARCRDRDRSGHGGRRAVRQPLRLRGHHRRIRIAVTSR